MNSEKNKKKDKKKKSRLLPIICGVIIGILLGIVMDEIPFISSIFELSFGELLIVFLSVIPAYFIHVAVHEAGHLLFGLLCGYKFSSYRFLGLIIYKKDGKLHHGTLSVPGTAGQCLMIPPEMKDGKLPVFLYNMGGVALNFILSILTFLLMLVFKDTPMLCGIMLFATLIGIAMVLLNGIPIKTELIANDGYNALSLSKDPAALKAFYVQMNMNAAMTGGTRLRDMPSEWFYVPSTSEMDNVLVASMATIMHSRLMDEHKFHEARELALLLLEGNINLPGIHRSILVMELMFLDLLLGYDTEIIDEKLADPEMQNAMKIMARSPSAKRLNYTIALLHDKDESKANEAFAEFEKLSKAYPYKQEIDGEIELIEEVKQKYYVTYESRGD